MRDDHQLNTSSGTIGPISTGEAQRVDEQTRDEILAIADRFDLTYANAEIAHERQKVYGDPKINHDGIAQSWAGILQPYAIEIAMMNPIPAHVVALLMASLKLNRMRMRYHADNYADIENYLAFARTWQREDGNEKAVVIGPRPSTTARLVLRWEEPRDSVGRA